MLAAAELWLIALLNNVLLGYTEAPQTNHLKEARKNLLEELRKLKLPPPT